MFNRTPAPRARHRRCLRSLLWPSIFVLGIGQANAQPGVYDLAPVSLLAQGEPLGSKQPPPAELDQVLRATRAKFEELSGAIATLAADSEVHNEIGTLKRENERLVGQLQQESAARHFELESSNELAVAGIAELSKAVDAAARLPLSKPHPSKAVILIAAERIEYPVSSLNLLFRIVRLLHQTDPSEAGLAGGPIRRTRLASGARGADVPAAACG